MDNACLVSLSLLMSNNHIYVFDELLDKALIPIINQSQQCKHHVKWVKKGVHH